MGTKYTTVAVSGYNSSPPADDASQSESNKVKWSTIKTKLPDPLKTAIEAVNSALVTALDQSVRSVSTADSTVAGDHNRTIQIASTVTASITISLGDAATMAAGYIVTVANQSNVACVVDRVTASNTINGVTASVPIAPLESITFIINSSTNGYVVKGRGGPTVDSNAIVVGSADATKKIRFEVDGLTTATTRVLTIVDADYTIPAPASQAEQETGTSLVTAVTPGRQQYHPSAAKAWVNFKGTGTVTINVSYNVTSITDNGTGDYTVNFTTAFSTANYSTAMVTGRNGGGATGLILLGPETVGATTTAFRLIAVNTSFLAADAEIVGAHFFGDQ